MPYEEEILKELKKISKIITISNGPIIEKELSNYATSEDRKKIWVLIDGNRQADDIVKSSGLTQAPVYKFLKILEDSGLIERQRGKSPKRLLDYVPADWVELVQTDYKSSENILQQTETSTEDVTQTPTEVETHG